MPIIDLESMVSIKELLTDSKSGEIDIDPNAYFQRFALNTSLTLNYGIRIDGMVDNELLKEIVHVERVVSNLRSTSNNWQDYIPLLRLWPSRNSQAGEYRVRRDKYLTLLLNILKDKIAKGEDKPCITGNVLKDPEAKLTEGELRKLKDLLTSLQPTQDLQLISRSGTEVHMSNNGLCRSRYCPRQPHHGNRLSLFTARPRNTSTRLFRDHASLS